MTDAQIKEMKVALQANLQSFIAGSLRQNSYLSDLVTSGNIPVLGEIFMHAMAGTVATFLNVFETNNETELLSMFVSDIKGRLAYARSEGQIH